MGELAWKSGESLAGAQPTRDVEQGVGSLADYLLAAGACEERVLLLAVERQRLLRERGYEVSLGELLVEGGHLDRAKLTAVSRQRDLDFLARSPLFKNLDQQQLVHLFDRGAIQEAETGTVLYRQGIDADRLFVILAGAVSLTRLDETGHEREIAVLAGGEQFGDISLLAAVPQFVTAIALGRCRLFSLPGEVFRFFCQEHPLILQNAVGRWFNRLVEGRTRDARLQERQYSHLFSNREGLPCLQLVGDSLKARRQRRRLQELAAIDAPVLLLGEKGTMKKRTAQYLHETGPNAESPFIVYDAAEEPAFLASLHDRGKFLFGGPEAVQMASLFGVEAKGMPEGFKADWQGFIKLACGGTLVIHHVGRLTVKVQGLLARYLETGSIAAVGGVARTEVKTRLVFTEQNDLDIEKKLLDRLRASTVVLTPLKERRKDLKEAVSVLLEEFGRKAEKDLDIDQEAINRILAYRWPGNYRELEEVVRRAVSLCQGERIGSGDIFVGRVSITGKQAYNLLQLDSVRHLFRSPLFPVAAQIAITALFLVVVLLGLFGSPSADSNVSLLLVWANWEPLLIISCLFLARIWCSLCPIGFVAQLFQRLPLKRFTLSPRAVNGGLFISAVGLAVVFWSQAALDMWQHPVSTAGLLLAMLGSAIFFSLLYEGRLWCRSLCPLGQMVATFGRISVLEVRSNFNYCSHQCHTYDCFTGRDGMAGCSLVKGPFALESNHYCTLCGNCIKTCPNQSVQVNLRPPGWELWNMPQADLAALIFVPMLWGTQLFRLMQGSVVEGWLRATVHSQAVVYWLLLACGILFSYHLAVAGISFMARTGREGRSPTLFVFAMLPLAYAIEVALRLGPLFSQAADFFKVLGRQVGYNFPTVAFRLDVQSIFILQVVIIAIGLAFSLSVQNRQLAGVASDRGAAFFRQLPLFVMAAVSIYFL